MRGRAWHNYCEEEVIVELFDLEEFIEEYPKSILEEVNSYLMQRMFEPLDLQTKGDKKNKPSIEEPPELELKSLPNQ